MTTTNWIDEYVGEMSTIKAEMSGQLLKTRSDTPFQGQHLQPKPQLQRKIIFTLWY